jgi:hypothetical protein
VVLLAHSFGSAREPSGVIVRKAAGWRVRSVSESRVSLCTGKGPKVAVKSVVLFEDDDDVLKRTLGDELVLDNADLQLLHRHAPLRDLSEEQEERRFALFGILVSIFERAYILVYEERMSRQTRRLWYSWEDYMREWCRRPEFRKALPELLEGEDLEFRNHIESIAKEFSGVAGR